MKKGRGNNKGYTLVELLVALAVSAILFACMIAVMAPIYRIYARTRERADAQLVAGVVLDSVRATCSNARTIEALGNSTLLINDISAFTEENGYLMFDDDTTDGIDADLVLGTDAYNGKTITAFGCTGVGENMVALHIAITGEDGVVCELTSTIASMRAVLQTPSP